MAIGDGKTAEELQIELMVVRGTNQSMQRKIDSLAVENQSVKESGRQAEAERDNLARQFNNLARQFNNLADIGAGIFRKINRLATEALGHEIEPGHTADYAVELLIGRLREIAVERDAAKGELTAVRKVIDDRSICERDVTAPLSERIDQIIVDLRSDRHNSEMDAVDLRRQRDRFRTELDRLMAVIRKSCDEHVALAAQYEVGGNTRGAMQLRAVGNLLGAILRGAAPLTVCPPVANSPGSTNGESDHA